MTFRRHSSGLFSGSDSHTIPALPHSLKVLNKLQLNADASHHEEPKAAGDAAREL